LSILISCTKSNKNFNVSDYGAIGDGLTDDGPAIRKTIEAAVFNGLGSRVIFEKKSYRLGKFENPYQIVLKGVSGITIDGNGAEIINNPYNAIIDIDSCENINVRGFTFDCFPLPFTQGNIIKVEPERGLFYLKIHEGYENPVKVYKDLGKKPDWGWDVCMDPVERKRKPEAIDHFFIKEVTEVNAEDNVMKVVLTKAYQKYAKELSIGDRFVITLKYGTCASNIRVSKSKDVHLEDYTFYTAKYGMTHSFSENIGRIYVKGVNISFRPGTDRLITTPRDGFHCKHNVIGPIIEDGFYEGMLDDAINISVCPYWVKEDLGDNRYLIADSGFSPHKGDSIIAYTPKSGLVTKNLKILNIELQPTPAGQQGVWNIITLDKSIPEVALHQGNNLFPGGDDKLAFTGLYNVSESCKDYIIRNNIFREQRRHGVLARSSGGLIEGNSFIGVGGCGIYLGNEIGNFFEGPFPANITIRNNRFINTFLTSIIVSTKGNNVWAKNINITDNFFSGWYTDPRNNGPAAAIQLDNVEGGIVSGNIFESGKADSLESFPIILKHSINLKVERNKMKCNIKD